MTETMTSIPDLWPKEIRVNVLTPLAILRTQADFLRKRTGGLLLADVVPTYAEGRAHYAFDLVAPALAHYRVPIMEVVHVENQPYPATVTAEGLLDHTTGKSGPRTTLTQDEFIATIQQVLTAKETRGKIDSLIARSNEMLPRSASDTAALGT